MKKNIKIINNILLLITAMLIIIVIFVLFRYEFNTSNSIIIYSNDKNYTFYDLEKYYELEIGDGILLRDMANEEHNLEVIDLNEYVYTNEGMVYQYSVSSLDNRNLKETSYYFSSKKTLLKFILKKYIY